MAGHSKWANIKHKKGKQDAVKGKIFTKFAKAIAVAAKEGGADPDNNAKLRDIIAKAKAQNMPNDNIERAIKKGAGELEGSHYEEIIYEGYGPGGVAVIVETLTDNKNRTAGDVRHIFDKNGGNLGTSGCVSFLFKRKGQLMIEKDENVDEDKLMLLAIDAGAEDFIVEEEGYEIITDPNDFGEVREALESENINFVSAEIAMIPTTQVALSAEDVKKMQKMLDMFEEHDDVQEVYHNWDMPEDME
ncbi:YebC/PmpR family DNA-binding transcriptional regulator [Garciella nitratireducens]|uniref:Probable transcriptional regulatory protein SAMN02745973_00287 n=1 Tax=Garciella nitratireducens DSM 15102 TaxID=1121911 RepID=A0A1T4K1R5_9FIRM|nr:YebC/PmpR family DNA-binding transcriptional regulator [Garciella nitratireducens]RBP46618.1 YebC/PmpR family DNA-binding regulatory protein [Garciella nitratireducens]SJZ36381.1 DNA-binding regulatory protein, YebC/PmpR family [Garciella nitratireducens DSM 15102]